MKTFILLGALALVGCSAIPTLERNYIVEGNAVSVVVGWDSSAAGANSTLATADAHCQKFDKHARFSASISPLKRTYDCVQ
jgi:hypothetical protein